MKSVSQKNNRIIPALAVGVSLLYCLLGNANFSQAAPADWLALEPDAYIDVSRTQLPQDYELRKRGLSFFADDTNINVTITQSIRGVMDPNPDVSGAKLVDAMLGVEAVRAADWLASTPHSPVLETKKERVYFECELENQNSRIMCNDPHQAVISVNNSDFAPMTASYPQELVNQIRRTAFSSSMVENLQPTESVAAVEIINLISKTEGLLTVDAGSVKFNRTSEAKQIKIDSSLSVPEWSVFVRDGSVVDWDEKSKTLTSKKPGKTEMFVVTPGRISIIPVSINGTDGSARSTKIELATKNDLASNFTSLDGLDQAATRGAISANFGEASSAPSLATDLVVGDDVTKLGRDGLGAVGQIVRAKAKVKFDSIRIKLVDERSVLGGANFPVSGARVKVAGTDFSELTDASGEVDIRDIPAGARILVEISDDRGYLMPQVTEIVADRDGNSRSVTQLISVRRFTSLDFVARSGGVVQDMRRASFCGTVSKSGQTLSGATVALDVFAVGPFYFNKLGLVDLRQAGTGPNGRFCFFNVDPGPVTTSIRLLNEKNPFSGLMGLASGRHAEEIFDLNDAKYVATTMTAIATANEQLGSDAYRANRHDLVEQADIFAIGSGHLMVEVDQGMMSTATKVLPIKGRVWTVSSSQDFETTVQPISVGVPVRRQISTLLPNGFVSDMAVFAQSMHQHELGSVVVEHGQLSGHGSDGVKFRLVDSSGRDAGDGWYFSDQPVAKAIFFNVPPGVYSLIVETSAGHWIASDTTVVYSESVSFVKTGSPLEKVENLVQRALSH